MEFEGSSQYSHISMNYIVSNFKSPKFLWNVKVHYNVHMSALTMSRAISNSVHCLYVCDTEVVSNDQTEVFCEFVN